MVFLCDAGPVVGGGHVMRSLTLARALQALGTECAFVATPEVAALLDAFAPDMGRTGDTAGAEAVVVDGYRADAAGDRALAAAGAVVAAIDDLADRPRAVSLLIDPGFGRTAADYAGLTPLDAKLLLGPDYALIRPEFERERAVSLATRGRPRMLRGLISLGLTDVGGATEAVVDALAEAAKGVPLDVVLGPSAPSLPGLLAREGPGLGVHVATKAMAVLMTRADLAVGAGGGTAWERACLGLPAVTVVLADNQRPMARAMEAAGLTIAVERAAPDFEARLAAAWTRLASDAALRAAISKRLAALCDGRGAERAASVLLGLIRERRAG